MNKTLFGIAIGILLFNTQCGSNESYIPKPKSFPRIVFPAKEYYLYQNNQLPYSFEIPKYAQMQKDSTGIYTKEKTWYNLNFMPFGATLHITHHSIVQPKDLDSMLRDTRKFVNKHVQRAENILEKDISKINSAINGIWYEIQGQTASNCNFYITDNKKNFFRGALYFNQKAEADSLQPYYAFMQQDIEHLIKTFYWKN